MGNDKRRRLKFWDSKVQNGRISAEMHNEEGTEQEQKLGDEQSVNQVQENEVSPDLVADDIIEKLKAENDGLKDAMMRTMAEAQNIRRRIQDQMAIDKKYGAEGFVRELLPVLDNFSRTLHAIEKGASLDALVDGVKSIEKQMLKALEKGQVQKIEAVGQPFDPKFHEALVTHETDEYPNETVLDELEAGYILHDRVIRPARVRVSKTP